jgi:hypothetical protein
MPPCRKCHRRGKHVPPAAAACRCIVPDQYSKAAPSFATHHAPTHPPTRPPAHLPTHPPTHFSPLPALQGFVVLNRPYVFQQWVRSHLASIPEKYVLMTEPDHIFLAAPPLWATPTR